MTRPRQVTQRVALFAAVLLFAGCGESKTETPAQLAPKPQPGQIVGHDPGAKGSAGNTPPANVSKTDAPSKPE